LREIFREQGLGMWADRRFFLGITGFLILRKEEPPAPAGV
jgi:hypothetical protein